MTFEEYMVDRYTIATRLATELMLKRDERAEIYAKEADDVAMWLMMNNDMDEDDLAALIK